MFDPLILKISARIHHRVHGRIAVDELHEAGKQEFRKLTLLTYIPHGKSQFNRYIESYLHAELWKLFKPLIRETPTPIEDLDFIADQDTNHVSNKHAENIASYAMINLSCSEKRIIKDCVIGGMSNVEESKNMGISKVRVSQLKSKALKRLKQVMESYGIEKEDA